MSLKLKLITYTSLLTFFLSGCDDNDGNDDSRAPSVPPKA